MKVSHKYTYDSMGNILILRHNGLVDNLTYTYNGNQCIKISDNIENPSYVWVLNFIDGTRQRTVRSIRRGNAVLKDSTDYCGNLLLKNGVPYMYRFPGGYISFSDGVPSGCHYYIEDYLGNVRMVVDSNNKKEQVTHYYPYGGVIGGIAQNAQLQPYKFGSNEFERTCGLDWYDIHARQYDPIVPFDQKVIDTAKSFGNEEDFSYSILPTNESEGNCNTSTSTILYKSGISQDALNMVKKLMVGAMALAL